MTVFPVPAPCDMNSRFVRSTRKASLTASRPSARTAMPTGAASSPRHGSRRRRPPARGISPAKGIESASTSFFPRTLVFEFSRMKRTVAGSRSPMARAISNTLRLLGAVGTFDPVGGVMSRVL